MAHFQHFLIILHAVSYSCAHFVLFCRILFVNSLRSSASDTKSRRNTFPLQVFEHPTICVWPSPSRLQKASSQEQNTGWCTQSKHTAAINTEAVLHVYLYIDRWGLSHAFCPWGLSQLQGLPRFSWLSDKNTAQKTHLWLILSLFSPSFLHRIFYKSDLSVLVLTEASGYFTFTPVSCIIT